jgi:hypothetical protein
MVFKDLRVIGYFRFRISSENSLVGTIGLDLDPKVHGKGLSKKLYFLFCKDIVKLSGVEHLTLRVLKTNSVALALYKSMEMNISEETTIDYAMTISVVNLLRVLGSNN